MQRKIPLQFTLQEAVPSNCHYKNAGHRIQQLKIVESNKDKIDE